MSDDWRRHAACRGEDPDLFFWQGQGPANYAQASAICAVCPVNVRDACIEDEISRPGELFGMRGGLNPKQLEAMRRARRRALA